MYKLTPDQASVIDNVRDLIRIGRKSVLIQAATGAGKTVMAGEVVRGAYNKGKRVRFIVPRRELLRQTSKTFANFGIDHGYIAAGYPHTEHNIKVCTTGTLINRLDDADLIVVDETHYGGDALDKIIKHYEKQGAVVLGLSATPWKLSGKGLGCWYGDMVQGESMKWLIENNRLSRYRAFAPDVVDLSGVRVVAGDYVKKQLAERMEQDKALVGNAVTHYKDHANGSLNIAYCVSRAHSEIVAQSFRDSGIPAWHMDGETPDDERVRIIKAFARREILVLSNCDLLTFGFDLSSASGLDVTVETMSDLRPTKSLSLQLQKWGRVLRYKDYPAKIFDHANNFSEHGLPDDEREWTLADRVVEKRQQSERTVQTMTCKECFGVAKPFTSCPYCGVVREVEAREIKQVDGELKEIQAAMQRREKRIEVGKARTYDELKRIAEERNYSKGWIWYQMKLKNIQKD